MKVGIIHPSLNFCGGAEKVCLTIVDSLKKFGHHTSILTFDKTDWHRVEGIFGRLVKPDKEFTLTKETYAVKAIANIAEASAVVLKFLHFTYRLIEDFDVTINTYGDLDLLNVLPDLTYSGLPFSASISYPETAPMILRGRVPQSLYRFLIKLLTPIIAHRGLTIIANSSFTKKVLQRVYNSKVRIKVLHPPCDVERYLNSLDIGGKENTAVTISRFSPGKNLEIIPWIASRKKGWRFIIMGSATRTSYHILESLNDRIRLYNLEDRVELLVNASRFTVEKVLAKAKVYIHLMRNEPFGLSIVEAMAAGCVPIIHKSGGAWYDIMESRQGYYGFGYGVYSEIPIYMKALEDDRSYAEKSKRAVERARMFDTAYFQKGFIKEFIRVAKLKYDGSYRKISEI